MNDIALARGSRSALFAATDGGLFRSLDGGRTWGSVNRGLAEDVRGGGLAYVISVAVSPDEPTTSVRPDPAGVFLADDLGASWRAFGKPPVVAPAGDMVLTPDGTRLIVSGFGGLAVRQVPAASPCPSR